MSILVLFGPFQHFLGKIFKSTSWIHLRGVSSVIFFHFSIIYAHSSTFSPRKHQETKEGIRNCGGIDVCQIAHNYCQKNGGFSGIILAKDADKSATLGGYRLCQVKPQPAYKSHPFILLILLPLKGKRNNALSLDTSISSCYMEGDQRHSF